jgi:RHS repeat-associated protein
VLGSNTYNYIYDVNEERVGIQYGTTTHWTIRDFDNKPLIQFDSSQPLSSGSWSTTQWSWVESFVWSDGRMLAAERPAGQLHYHVDHLGSLRLVTDANGQLSSRINYAPYGEEMTTSGGELLKFTGHERDDDLSQPTNDNYLDYMHARYYDSRWGRFLAVDPTWSSADIGNPQSWNRYLYVLNNPVLNTDPDGRCSPIVIDCVLEVGAVAGGTEVLTTVAVGLRSSLRHSGRKRQLEWWLLRGGSRKSDAAASRSAEDGVPPGARKEKQGATSSEFSAQGRDGPA